LGKTAGRGGKGQTARTGKGRPRGFEGGQTPLYRRIPKYGFKRAFRVYFNVVNISALNESFNNGETVDLAALVSKGLARPNAEFIKVLGEGTLSKNLTIRSHRFSKSAIQKINQGGGKIEEIKLGSG
jgi:large subunit ribosomal protein L15